MDLETVERRGNAIIVVASFDMTKARPFGLAFCMLCFGCGIPKQSLAKPFGTKSANGNI